MTKLHKMGTAAVEWMNEMGGTKEWNAFKEYVTADNAAQAKKQLREELKADGYKNIAMEAVEVR